MAQSLDQLSLLNHSGTRAHLTETFSCPNGEELKTQTVHFLCLSDLQETYGWIQAKETFYLSLLFHILRGRFMPFRLNSQNYFKFLSFRGDMTNSHRDSRATLLNHIICYSGQKWIDWNQNLVKQMIWLMPLNIKSIKYWKQLTQLSLTWDICTLHFPCLFSSCWPGGDHSGCIQEDA